MLTSFYSPSPLHRFYPLTMWYFCSEKHQNSEKDFVRNWCNEWNKFVMPFVTSHHQSKTLYNKMNKIEFSRPLKKYWKMFFFLFQNWITLWVGFVFLFINESISCLFNEEKKWNHFVPFFKLFFYNNLINFKWWYCVTCYCYSLL